MPKDPTDEGEQAPMVVAANESPSSGYSSGHSDGDNSQYITRIREALDTAAARARQLDEYDMQVGMRGGATLHAPIRTPPESGAACAKFSAASGSSPQDLAPKEKPGQAAESSGPAHRSSTSALRNNFGGSVAYSKFLHMEEQARKCEERAEARGAHEESRRIPEDVGSGHDEPSLPMSKRERRGEACGGADEDHESISKRARRQPQSP